MPKAKLDTYDIGIVGAGVAGSFAAYNIALKNPNLKTFMIDYGRPPAKRRPQMHGFFGLMPNSDGKLYMRDVDKLSKIMGKTNANKAGDQMVEMLNEIIPSDLVLDKRLSAYTERRLKKFDYEYHTNDYIQLVPKQIHLLSKHIASAIKENENITTSFDNEVLSVTKRKNGFIINSEYKDYLCKKLILCTGRSGWRWISEIFNKLNIIKENNVATFGIKIEIPESYLNDYDHCCSSFRKGHIEIGPLSWNGTVIPEDHYDFTTSAFRSNEERWKSNNVSFSLLSNQKFKGEGSQQVDRIAKLTYILSNDRVAKERLLNIINKKSRISILPEYDWLIHALKDLENIMPDIIEKANFHVPAILPVIPKIDVKENFETKIPGLYVSGENSGTTGLLSAIISGWTAAESIITS